MASRKVSATLTYHQPGTNPPVYVAGSFSDPPWQPLEMECTRNDEGEDLFTKEIMVDAGSEIQYKYRIGPDWWTLDPNAETVSDEQGNTNNILRAQTEEPELEQAEAQNIRVNELKAPDSPSGTQTPEMADTAAEVAESASMLDPETPEPKVSDEDAGRTGLRRMSNTPIGEVASTAAEVADEAAKLEDESLMTTVDDDGQCPMFSHECFSEKEAAVTISDQETDAEAQPEQTSEEAEIDDSDPRLERFPSERDAILATMRRLSTSVEPDRSVGEAASLSAIVSPTRSQSSKATDQSMDSPEEEAPSSEPHHSPANSVHSSGAPAGASLQSIAESDEVPNGEAAEHDAIMHTGPALKSPISLDPVHDEGIAMSNSPKEQAAEQKTGSEAAAETEDAHPKTVPVEGMEQDKPSIVIHGTDDGDAQQPANEENSRARDSESTSTSLTTNGQSQLRKRVNADRPGTPSSVHSMQEMTDRRFLEGFSPSATIVACAGLHDPTMRSLISSPVCPSCLFAAASRLVSRSARQPWAAQRLFSRRARPGPSRMVLSDRVDRPRRDAGDSERSPRRREGPFGGMNQTVANIRPRPSSHPSSRPPSRHARGARDDYTRGGSETRRTKAMKMQGALSTISYGHRTRMKETIAEIDSFDKFNLLPPVQEAISSEVLKGMVGIKPTPIQRLAVPTLLGQETGRRSRTKDASERQEVLLAAETGSGKTLAYLLPAVNDLKQAEQADPAIAEYRESFNQQREAMKEPGYTGSREFEPHPTTARPKVVVLVPTAELVDQVGAVAKALSHVVKFRTSGFSANVTPKIIDATMYNPGGIDMVIATPHLLASMADSDPNILSRVRYLVVDEADSLLDRSFSPVTTSIIDRALPSVKTLVMCSATIPKRLDNTLATEFPNMVRITTPNLHAIPRRVQLGVIDVTKDLYRNNKDLACADAIWSIGKDAAQHEGSVPGEIDVKRIMVFVNEREKTQEVAQYLVSKGIDAVALHRDTSEQRQSEMLDSFTTKEPLKAKLPEGANKPAPGKGRRHLPNTKVIVATDLASRGIDTLAVRHVILYDVPHTTIDFIHRLGRAGRMGRRGRGVVLVGRHDRRVVPTRATKANSPAPAPDAPPPAEHGELDPESDIYDVSDREKQKAEERRNSLGDATNARTRSTATITSNPQQTRAITRARQKRDSAMDRLENMTSTTDTAAEDNSADRNSPVEVGRRDTNTPDRVANLSGLDLDDSMFDYEDLNTTFNPGSASVTASAHRSAETSTLSATHFKRRPRAGSFLSRDDGPIRPSSRAGPNTPSLSSTFNIGLFRRRAREPSILGTAQKPRPQRPEPEQESEQDNEAADEDDFTPEAESTPLNPAEASSSANPKKRKSNEGHERRLRSSPYGVEDNVRDSVENQASDAAMDNTSPQPSLPHESERPSTPPVPDEFMAPPLSSGSSTPDAEIWPPLQSLAKARPRRPNSGLRRTPVRDTADDNVSDMSSPPSLTYSPNYADEEEPALPTRAAAAKAKRKPDPKLTTADLANLLPRRRQRRARGNASADDPFTLDDDDNDVDVSGLAPDADELSHLDVRARRRQPAGSRARKDDGAKGTSASKGKGKATAQRRTTRTYGRPASDKENENEAEDAAGGEEEEEGQQGEAEPETSQMMVERMGTELKDAARKFQEVDRWELDYEEMTQSSSPPHAR
ncbi:hypothetical protein F4780DRAFT_768715 [Xylariomycetidae sp. FL0641]|nr:hypothetical protein F4780DRAFT_768715 [Xylariomycetidae sp. FL0641]